MSVRDEDPTDPRAARDFRVEQAESGQRLDRVLVKRLDLSRSRIQEWIRDGGVHVQGEPCLKPSFALEAGWRVLLRDVPRSRERRGGPEQMELCVVFEDDHLALIDKPAGMVAHPSSTVRGGTVSERAVERWGELPTAQGEDRPGIVHRLDSDTSGLMLIAKTDEAARALVDRFRAREVQKQYLALVHGVPRFDSDWIEYPIGRSTKHPDRMSIVPDGEGVAAETYYETRERFDGYALVACYPKTGRTHQIRVHLTQLDFPILGDRLYRGRRGLTLVLPKDGPALERHMLHARRLRFSHPVTGEALEFVAEPPSDFQAWVEWLRARVQLA